MHRTGKFTRGSLVIEIDPTDIDTPAMVYLVKKGKIVASGTWHCVWAVGEIDGYELTEKQVRWIESFEDDVDAAFDIARPEGWDQRK